MNASLRTVVLLALGAVGLTLQSACARSVTDVPADDSLLAPNNPAPLAACIQTECPKPWASCGGATGPCTTDTSRDVDHCGACGTGCPQPLDSLHATAVCSQSVCAIACDELYADCNHKPDDGCEVFVGDDPKNCGACGHACKDGEICWRGACGCPGGFAACGNECKNLSSDDSACGSCNTKCGPPPIDDPAWTCGPGVQPPDTTWGCTGAGCKLTCAPSYGDCNHDLCRDGCESDLSRDAANCGGCGHACGAGQECMHGTCLCPAGTTRCFDQCVDTSVDVNHCGSCDNACPGASDATANGGPTCVGGHCGYVCYAGFADCNHLINDGCEVNIATDQHHCGSCTTQCDTARSQPCVQGQCLTKPCDAPEATK